jgi:hypothetical protein
VAVRPGDCPREAELLEALRAAWPEGCPNRLRDHAASCASCAALADVVLPLLDDHQASVRAAAVPSSAAMWWRLQTRARREAEARAMRPIAAGHAVALAAALSLLAATLGLVVPGVWNSAAWWREAAGSAALDGAASLPSTAAQLFSPAGIALGLASALLLVAAPVAIYFALSDR